MSNAFIKSPQEIAIIAEGGKILAKVLAETAQLVQPGISTFELNEFAEKAIRAADGTPSFIGYGSKKNPFPSGLCTSVNDVVVHGIPSKDQVLAEGDIIGLDIGMQYKGLFTDTAVTVAVGSVSSRLVRLLETTKRSLEAGIDVAREGNRIGDISAAIEAVAKAGGYGIVRDLVGHGVGYAVHEDPMVPNFGRKGTGPVLKAGMVLAIEPMFTLGRPDVYFDNDGWTIRTEDGSMAAHFEHSIVITKTGAEILT